VPCPPPLSLSLPLSRRSDPRESPARARARAPLIRYCDSRIRRRVSVARTRSSARRARRRRHQPAHATDIIRSRRVRSPSPSHPPPALSRESAGSRYAGAISARAQIPRARHFAGRPSVLSFFPPAAALPPPPSRAPGEVRARRGPYGGGGNDTIARVASPERARDKDLEKGFGAAAVLRLEFLKQYSAMLPRHASIGPACPFAQGEICLSEKGEEGNARC